MKKIFIFVVIILGLSLGTFFMTAYSFPSSQLKNTSASSLSPHQNNQLPTVAQLTQTNYQPENTASPVPTPQQSSPGPAQSTVQNSSNKFTNANTNNTPSLNTKTTNPNTTPQSNGVPPGATALCIDGVYKFTMNKDACADNGYVEQWLVPTINLSL